LKIPKEWLSPVIWGIPLAVLLVDAAVRGKVFVQWSLPEWAVYLFSAAVGLLFWFLFFHLGVLLFKSGRAITALAVLLVFLAEICALIISYGFYQYFRGIPNYFVGEFILQEPKDFYSGVTGTVTAWHFSALALLTVGLSGLWIRQVKNFSGFALSLRQLGAGLLLFAISGAGILKAVRVYDQAAMPDLNTIFLSSHLVVNNLILKKQVEGGGLRESRRISLPRAEAAVPLNILLILNESLRRASLHPFGYPEDTTPFISRFIREHPEEVFVFKRAYSNSTFTMLSVPSLATGVSPLQPGETLHRMPLLFDYGKCLDYRTFFISSQTLEWRNIGQFFNTPNIDFLWNKDAAEAPRVHDIGTDDRFVAEQWKAFAARLEGERFLGVLQTYANHYPYFAPKKTFNLLKRYHQSIGYLDSVIEKIFQTLEEEGFLENTVVVFTSDHGEAFNEHGYYGHLRTYYEEESGIPLWMYVPRQIQAYYGDRIANLRDNTEKNVSNLDLVPTLIDLLNLQNLPEEITQNLPGASLLSPLDPDRSIYMLNNNEVTRYRIFLSIGVLKGDYKYLFIRDGEGPREEFYNLALDPGEKINIIAHNREKVLEIYRELDIYDAPPKILHTSRRGVKVQF